MNFDESIINKIVNDWFYYWNGNDLESYVNLYDEDAILFSNCAKFIIPDSNGVIKGQKTLIKYWSIVKDVLPHFRFELNSFSIYDNCVVIRYCLETKKEHEVFARLYLNSNYKINKIEVAYFDTDFENK